MSDKKSPSHIPHNPVDGFVSPEQDPAAFISRRALRLLPNAVLFFGVFAAVGTAFAGYHSEDLGVFWSQIAIFPLAFGFIAKAAEHPNDEADISHLKVAAKYSLVVVGIYVFFMQAIWPGL